MRPIKIRLAHLFEIEMRVKRLKDLSRLVVHLLPSPQQSDARKLQGTFERRLLGEKREETPVRLEHVAVDQFVGEEFHDFAWRTRASVYGIPQALTAFEQLFMQAAMSGQLQVLNFRQHL